MMKARTKVIAAGLALCGMPAPALANDYLYKGDCERAEIVMQERTMDKLLPYKTYHGVQLINNSKNPCGFDAIIHRKMNLVEITPKSASFKIEEYILNNDIMIGQCNGPKSFSVMSKGTFTITLEMKKSDLVCEIYLQADRRVKLTKYDWDSITKFRIVLLNDGSFVDTSAMSTSGLYTTPSAFVGS